MLNLCIVTMLNLWTKIVNIFMIFLIISYKYVFQELIKGGLIEGEKGKKEEERNEMKRVEVKVKGRYRKK